MFTRFQGINQVIIVFTGIGESILTQQNWQTDARSNARRTWNFGDLRHPAACIPSIKSVQGNQISLVRLFKESAGELVFEHYMCSIKLFIKCLFDSLPCHLRLGKITRCVVEDPACKVWNNPQECVTKAEAQVCRVCVWCVWCVCVCVCVKTLACWSVKQTLHREVSGGWNLGSYSVSDFTERTHHRIGV